MSASDRYIGYKIEEHRRQHPDERLLVAGRTAGAEPAAAADCRNPLRRHAVPDGVRAVRGIAGKCAATC